MVKSTKLNGFYTMDTVFGEEQSNMIYTFSDKEKHEFTLLFNKAMDIVFETILSQREKGENANELD